MWDFRLNPLLVRRFSARARRDPPAKPSLYPSGSKQVLGSDHDRVGESDGRQPNVPFHTSFQRSPELYPSRAGQARWSACFSGAGWSGAGRGRGRRGTPAHWRRACQAARSSRVRIGPPSLVDHTSPKGKGSWRVASRCRLRASTRIGGRGMTRLPAELIGPGQEPAHAFPHPWPVDRRRRPCRSPSACNVPREVCGAGIEVDPVPLQPQQLSLPRPGEQRRDAPGVPRWGPGCGQDPPDVAGRQGAAPSAPCSPRTRTPTR